ncbi:hypothetical protein P3S68_012528 [Capsicum galapagoense]
MASSRLIILLLFFTLSPIYAMDNFYQYYYPKWGQNHMTFLNESNEVQLLLDRQSGAGFKSKLQYESGLFTIRLKLPSKKTNGVITAFYLISDDANQGGIHDELDFEFIGTGGKFQTNLFANDMGGREEVHQLPFDPSQDYHTYQILYTPQRVVFFVDYMPIRTFKNNIDRGINYPTKPMWIEASLWYSDSAGWAGYVDWAKAPFIASFEGFNVTGCPYGSTCVTPPSFSPWIKPKLSPEQLKALRVFRHRHMTYDYCAVFKGKFPECASKNITSEFV